MEITQNQANKIAYFIFENIEEFINNNCKEYQIYLKEIGKDFVCGFNVKFSYYVFPIFISYT